MDSAYNVLSQCRSVSFAAAKDRPATLWWCKRLAFFVCLLGLLLIAPDLWAGTDFNAVQLANEQNTSLFFGLFLGVMLTGSAYLFFIGIVMRDRGQLYLLCLLLCLSLYVASGNHQVTAQLGLHDDTMRYLITTYSLIFACIFSACFTYYFLEIDMNCPALRWPLLVLGTVLVLVAGYSFIDMSLVRFVLPALNTISVMVILGIGIFCLQRGISGSLTHIIAFLFFLLGTLAEPLYDIGLINSASDGHHFSYIAFSMAALMFAIVIASQFAAQQDEKEKALAVSNERFTLATRGSNEGLFDWNLQTGEIFFSDQFRKIMGQRLENGPKSLRLWMRMMVPGDRRIVREALRRFRRNTSINTINVEYRIVQPNTSARRWLHSKAVAVRDTHSKKILRLVGSTADITNRKQSEVALRASEARFRSITEAHPVPVMIVGLRNSTVLYASPGAEQFLGLGQDRLLHEYFDRFLPDLGPREELMVAMRDGREVNLKEVELTRGDGRKLDAALSARRISYQSEDAMVIGIYDLTERKRAEAQISRQQEALQQSEKMAALGGLLAGVAHELNNPLSVVVGQATLLMEGSAEPKVVNRAEKIFKAADRCSRIVKSFLALARRKPPERKPVDLNAVVTAALDLLGFQLRTGNIEISQELAQNLPEITGDNDLLTQVITNLVLNGAQALDGWTGPRQIVIRSFAADGMVKISVSDSGPGIGPEIRQRVFEPFFTTKGSKGGTGVGLSLCLNIIASHGGEIQYQDTEGGGATFIVQLPMAEASFADGAQAPQEVITLPPNLRILLVDDELEIAQTLCDLLEPEGHDIDIAVNGAIALEKLKKKPFDLIISDLRMPVLDGPGLYDALGRELPSYLNKIIYVTGDTLSSHVQTFLNEHTVPLVEKPYRLVDVRRAMANLLRDDAQRTPAAVTSYHEPPFMMAT